MRRTLSAALIALAAGAAGPAVLTMSSVAAAQQMSDEEDARRRGQTLSNRVGGALGDIYNLINEEPPRLREALNELNQLANRDLEPFDRATVLEIRGVTNAQLDDFEAALRDYTEVLRIDVLDRQRTTTIRRITAQLFYQQERYDEAIRFMEQFLQASPDEATANDYFILAGAYYQNNQIRQALDPALNALRLDEEKKQYYDFLNSIYLELEMKEERGQLLERMVERFPSEEPYWSQLANVYSEAGNDQRAFATLWAAYRAGLIDEEAKIRALAQYYYQLDNPYPGAIMFSREMEAGNVERSLDNLRLLSQLWAAAREQGNAISILTEAAPKASSGDLYYQLGQSYSADEQWSEAIDAFRAALNKGGLSAREQGNIHLLIGNAYQSLDDETAAGRQRAIDAYRQAARFDSSRSAATSYIEYIRSVQNVECQQDERDRIQAVDRQQRAIESCRGMLEVLDLGGAIQTTDEQVAECRALIAKVEDGQSAEDLVTEALGPLDRSQCRGA